MTSPLSAWALRGQQLIQQIVDAPNEAAKLALQAALREHLSPTKPQWDVRRAAAHDREDQ